MAGNRSPWRALRPVLLAGAATLTWLTFSTSTASADTVPDTTSLLGGVTTSVSSVTEELPVPGTPAAAPATSTPALVASPGLLTPVVGEVSELADQIVSSAPAVNQVVPAGAVSVISIPVAQVADAAAAEVAEAVIPPVAETLPVLEPVLQPVSGLVTGTVPLPVELPELPFEHGAEETPAGGATVPAAAGAAGGEANTAHDSEVPSAEVASGAAPGGVALPAVSWASIARPDTGQEQPTADPSPSPVQAPAGPASGTGSSAPSAGPSSAAAWLSAFNFDPSAPGALRAGDTPEHAPAPVSFDPGSRPD